MAHDSRFSPPPAPRAGHRATLLPIMRQSTGRPRRGDGCHSQAMPEELREPSTRQRLAEFVARAAGAQSVAIVALDRMSGGAVQENWAFDVRLDGELRRWVLRTDSRASVAESLTRAQEFAVLKVAHAANVRAPQPLHLCEDPAVTGRLFFIMERL